jgi:hypothetical protein
MTGTTFKIDGSATPVFEQPCGTRMQIITVAQLAARDE